MEYPDLNEVERRSKRYWMVDGIPEIVMGVIWIIWGVGLLVQDALPRDSRVANAYSWLILLIMCVPASAAKWVMEKLKNKYTFPRGGYMQFRGPKPSQRILNAVLGGLIAAAFIVVIAFSMRHKSIADLAAPGIGVLMACVLLIASKLHGMTHWVWLSLISLVLGAALYPLKLGWMALPWFFIGIGVSFTAAGSCRFRVFVRNTPVPGGNES